MQNYAVVLTYWRRKELVGEWSLISFVQCYLYFLPQSLQSLGTRHGGPKSCLERASSVHVQTLADAINQFCMPSC